MTALLLLQAMSLMFLESCPSRPLFYFFKPSVKLHLMRRPNRYIWALGALVFATVLGLHGRTRHVAMADANSASGPSISKVSVESADLCEILLLQFHGCTHALSPTPVSLESRSIRIRQLADLIDVSSESLYDPIQRRPPPSLS